jgi:hypothetical protein
MWFGLIVAILSTIGLWSSIEWAYDSYTTLLSFAAALTGIMVGLIAIPLSPLEKSRFDGVAKLLWGFLAGYFATKLQPSWSLSCLICLASSQ